jgi:hypothetical protein
MKEHKDEKWLDETISRATDLGDVKFDAEKWREKYILNKSSKTSQAYFKYKPHYNIWRIIMESKVTRYSAAAVVALAAALVLFGPFGPSKNGGVVLADVQQKVDGIETMIMRGKRTFTQPGKDGEIFEVDGIKGELDIIKYSSIKYGMVEEGYAEDKLVYRITFDFRQRRTLLLFPLYKKYLTFTSMDSMKKMMESFATPNGIFNLLLECNYKKLGRDKLDGVEVEAFEFQRTEPSEELLPRAVFDIQTFKGKVWIGIKEQLPVRIEGDLVIGKSFMSMFHKLNMHEVSTMGEYNVELEEDIFDTNPPEGYTELKLSDILQFIPTEVKAGVAGLGLGVFIIPASFIVRKKHRKKKIKVKQD